MTSTPSDASAEVPSSSPHRSRALPRKPRKPKYSICVSNLNSVHTVAKWAESLLRNLAGNEEVIIIDGMSSDGSREWLEEFCIRHDFVFVAKRTNMGEARRLASQISRGEYVIFQLDTDDRIVALQEALKLYHRALERDPVTGVPRSFRCPGFFIIPRWMLDAVDGYPPIQYYEDQLLAYRLASKSWLTASWKITPVVRGHDAKKRRLRFRLRYSFQRIRDGLRLGFFEARNLQGFLLLPPAWVASRRLEHFDFRRDWWNLDVHRDGFIVSWLQEEGLTDRLLLREACG